MSSSYITTHLPHFGYALIHPLKQLEGTTVLPQKTGALLPENPEANSKYFIPPKSMGEIQQNVKHFLANNRKYEFQIRRSTTYGGWLQYDPISRIGFCAKVRYSVGEKLR
jgi:hypothetical protein